MAKKQVYVGIDQDVNSVRGARLVMEAPPTKKDANAVWKLAGFEEIMGDMGDPVKSAVALKKLKDKLGVQSSDIVSICLGGKQTYAVQMDVKKLPDEEMYGMLRLEMRKSMPFEASVSTFDYQFLPVPPDRPKDSNVPVIVSAVTNAYLSKRVQSYDGAGLKASYVNLLPVTVANAFWAAKSQSPAADPNETHVILHIGAEMSTLVIDGAKSPFFNRSFAFNSSELTDTKEGTNEATSQAVLQLNILSSEITKSISYYRNTFPAGNISTITVMGDNATNPAFDVLGQKTGLAVQTIQTASMVRSAKPPQPGKFDLAIALAMQAAGA